MQGVEFTLSGPLGHFKRPETNNNPCTYSIMHKVAIIGLVGAVVGIEREEMKKMYSSLCDNFLYSLTILNRIITEAKPFSKIYTTRNERGRRYCEVLKDIYYKVILGIKDNNYEDILNIFIHKIKNNLEKYTACFGIVSCPADVEFIRKIEISNKKSGPFSTRAIISPDHIYDENSIRDLVYDRIPVRQSAPMYNDQFVEVICLQEQAKVNGTYYEISNGERVWLF